MKLKTLVTTVVTSSLALLPGVAFAQLGNVGVDNVGVLKGNNLAGTVGNIVKILLMLAGLVAVIYLIYGGVKYITSQGEEEAAEEGKRVILYAIIGLIVIGISAVIVNYIVTAIFASQA